MHKKGWVALFVGLCLLFIGMIMALRIVADLTIDYYAKRSSYVSQVTDTMEVEMQINDAEGSTGEPT